MKNKHLILIAMLLISACAGNNNISVKGSNKGASGGVSQTIRF